MVVDIEGSQPSIESRISTRRKGELRRATKTSAVPRVRKTTPTLSSARFRPREPGGTESTFVHWRARNRVPVTMPVKFRIETLVLVLAAIIATATPPSPTFAHGWHCQPAWNPATSWHRHWQACGPNWGPPGWPRSRPPRRADFRCPPPGNINCMPPVRPDRSNFCRPEFVDWARRHCPGFDVVY